MLTGQIFDHKSIEEAMEVTELSTLNASKASDFAIHKELGSGQNGLVVAATCSRREIPDPAKLYAVKLLFNFTHEYTSVVRNAFENEWLVLSRLLPHENVVRFWAQFISVIPDDFTRLLPPDARQHCRKKKNRSGQMVSTKGQFLVLDYHPSDLERWMESQQRPLDFESLLSLTEQILEGIWYLEKNAIRHLDLKMSNVLVTERGKVVLCDFGCALQFADRSFTIPYVRGMLPGGNKAHLAPEVLNTHHKFKRNPSHKGSLNYSKQASFAAGVLICEIATGDHPLTDYPLGFTLTEFVTYTAEDIAGALPGCYPNSFRSIVSDMICWDPRKRLSIEEALNQLRVCCIKPKSVTGSQQGELERVGRERDLAKTKLHMVASERDFAMGQLREMAEQMQTVATEFKSMADHCDHIMKELEQVRKEKDSAVKACESAYEAGELLREQLALLMREKEIAESQVRELRSITERCQAEERIQECTCCNKFYIEAENSATACHYHKGRVSSCA